MEEQSLEVQLKVWKELAISKQMLMQKAAEKLGLAKDYTAEELEASLGKVSAAAKVAEIKLAQSIEKSSAEVKSLTESLEERTQEVATQQSNIESLEAAKAALADEIKKLKTSVADKQKSIKQITKTLADTPENVVKKMKALKKEKMDESKAKKQAEDQTKKIRKEKQGVEQKLSEKEAIVEKSVELAKNYRAMHQVVIDQYDVLIDKVEDQESLKQLKVLDDELLTAIEATVEKSDKKDKKEKKDK